MKRRSLLAVFALGATCLLAVMPLAAAEPPSWTFSAVDVPGATWTGAYKVNSRGDIVGYYLDKVFHGFLWRRGEASPAPVNVPEASLTLAFGINDSGAIVGRYNKEGKTHGYLLSGDTWVFPFDYPDPANRFNAALDINEAGEVLGYYNTLGLPPQPPEGLGVRGYLCSNGGFSSIQVPGATFTGPEGLNARGDIAGYYRLGDPPSWQSHGFVWFKSDPEPISIDFPGGTETRAHGINARGEVVGRFLDSSNVQHGFYRDDTGDLIRVDVQIPGIAVGSTRVLGINSSGDVVGEFYDSNMKQTRGFFGQRTHR